MFKTSLLAQQGASEASPRPHPHSALDLRCPLQMDWTLALVKSQIRTRFLDQRHIQVPHGVSKHSDDFAIMLQLNAPNSTTAPTRLYMTELRSLERLITDFDFVHHGG